MVASDNQCRAEVNTAAAATQNHISLVALRRFPGGQVAQAATHIQIAIAQAAPSISRLGIREPSVSRVVLEVSVGDFIVDVFVVAADWRAEWFELETQGA